MRSHNAFMKKFQDLNFKSHLDLNICYAIIVVEFSNNSNDEDI